MRKRELESSEKMQGSAIHHAHMSDHKSHACVEDAGIVALPLEIAAQLAGYVCLASGRKAHEHCRNNGDRCRFNVGEGNHRAHTKPEPYSGNIRVAPGVMRNKKKRLHEQRDRHSRTGIPTAHFWSASFMLMAT